MSEDGESDGEKVLGGVIKAGSKLIGAASGDNIITDGVVGKTVETVTWFLVDLGTLFMLPGADERYKKGPDDDE